MSTDTLDLPIIDANAPVPGDQPRTEVATAVQQTVTAEKLDLTKLALACFGQWRDTVATTKADLNRTVLDLTNATRIKEAKSLRERMINVPLAQHRATADVLKGKLNGAKGEVAIELAKIEVAYTDAVADLTARIEAAQKALDEAKAKKDREEQARKDAHLERIAGIKAWAEHARQPDMTAARIAAGIVGLEGVQIGKEFEEFEAAALDAKAQTLETMRVLQLQAQDREAQAAETERLRKLAEEQAAELARLKAAAPPPTPEPAPAPTPAYQQMMAQPMPTLAEDAAQAVVDGVAGDVPAPPAEGPPRRTGTVSFLRGGILRPQAPPPAPELMAEARELLDAAAVSAPITDPVAIEAAFSDDVQPAAEGAKYPQPEESLQPLFHAELVAAAHELVDHIAIAGKSRFPSQPKMEPAWWAELYGLVERVEARL